MKIVGFRQKLNFFLLICLTGILSCEKEAGLPKAGGKGEYEIRQEISRGATRTVLKVDRKEITVADPLHVIVEVVAEEGYEVEFPKIRDNKIGEFKVADDDQFPPELIAGKKVVYKHAYVLEPFLAGEYTVPPLKITFWKKTGKAEKHEYETKAVTVKVTSVLAANPADVKMKDILPPVELPRSGFYFYWLAGILAGIVVIIIVCWRLRRRRRKEEEAAVAIKIPAHELAFEELERLLAEKLVERGLVKVFYFRVSEILRRYIENRFGLHAPERTTEEFMAEIQQDHQLPAPYKPILREFLNHCDLVKFAEFKPEGPDIEKTLSTCRRFVVETTEAKDS